MGSQVGKTYSGWCHILPSKKNSKSEAYLLHFCDSTLMRLCVRGSYIDVSKDK